MFERPLFVGADIDDHLRGAFMFGSQAGGDLIEAYPVASDHVLALHADLDCFDVPGIDFAVILNVPGWKSEIEALFEQGRGNYENDEQHEGEVQQRSDVDVTQRDQRVAL